MEEKTNSNIYACGAVIDKNGKTSYWMIGGDREPRETPGGSSRERMQKLMEELKEKKAEEKREGLRLEKAETLEKLMEKTTRPLQEPQEDADIRIQEFPVKNILDIEA